MVERVRRTRGDDRGIAALELRPAIGDTVIAVSIGATYSVAVS